MTTADTSAAVEAFAISNLLIVIVMPGLVPGIHVFLPAEHQGVDGRDKPGHDGAIQKNR